MKKTGFSTIWTSKITKRFLIAGESYSKITDSALPSEIQGENAMKLMDEIRKQCGITFPADEK